MSSDEADFQSNLEDLESLLSFLSPISAQSRETTIVDAAQPIDFNSLKSYLYLKSERTPRAV